jgi:ADP-heptose:LPS heptosyltransferase
MINEAIHYTAIKAKSYLVIDSKHLMQPGQVYVFNSLAFSKLNENDLFRKQTTIVPGFFEQNYKKYRPEHAATLSDILVFRSGGIGDLIFSYPVLKEIKSRNIDCKITYITNKKNFDLINAFSDNLADKIIAMPIPGDRFRKADAHIIFEGVIENDDQAESLDAYNLFYQHVFDETGVNESLLPHFKENELIRQSIKEHIPNRLILIHMRSSSPFRNVSKSVWIDLINELVSMGYPIGFIDSADQAETIDKFIQTNFQHNKDKIHNLAKHATSLLHTIEICRTAGYAIGVDSSIINIFAATGKPCIGLYTCFPGTLRLGPFKNARIIQSTYVDCGMAPCFHHMDGEIKCADVLKGGGPGCIGGFDYKQIAENAAKWFVPF